VAADLFAASRPPAIDYVVQRHMKRVDVRVIPQPNVQVIHHWAPAILSTPSHLRAPVDVLR